MSKKNYWFPIACPSWSLSCLKKWLHFLHHFIPFHSITSVAYAKNLSIIIYCVQSPILLQSVSKFCYLYSQKYILCQIFSYHSSTTLLQPYFIPEGFFFFLFFLFFFFWACQVIPTLESLYLLFSVFRIDLKKIFFPWFSSRVLYIFAHISLSILFGVPHINEHPQDIVLCLTLLYLFILLSVSPH